MTVIWIACRLMQRCSEKSSQWKVRVKKRQRTVRGQWGTRGRQGKIVQKDRLWQKKGIIVTSFGSLIEPAAAWLLLSAHSSGIVHLSHPNKEPGSSTVHPPSSPGMDVALMLPTQTRQLSFLLPSKDVDKFFVLLESISSISALF